MGKYNINSINVPKGQSLIEIIVALGIGALLVGGSAGAIALIIRNNLETRTVQTASSLSQELMDNIQAITESDWHKIYDRSKGSGSHYYISSSTREIISGEESLSVENRNFTRYFYVENVNRTSCGTNNITDNAATGDCASIPSWPANDGSIAEDPSTQKITAVIKWGSGGTLVKTEYASRSRNLIFRQTDWSGGANQEGPITQVNDKFTSSTGIDFSTAGEIKIKF